MVCIPSHALKAPGSRCCGFPPESVGPQSVAGTGDRISLATPTAWSDIRRPQCTPRKHDAFHQRPNVRARLGGYQQLYTRMPVNPIEATGDESRNSQRTVPAVSCTQYSESGLARRLCHVLIASYLGPRSAHIDDQHANQPHFLPILDQRWVQMAHHTSIVVIPPNLRKFTAEGIVP